MEQNIKKVGILGSGVMGSGIAAHLASVGIRSCLLDIVPQEFTPEEEAKGITRDNPVFRNRIAEKNKAVLVKQGVLMTKDDASLITAGNLEDNLEWLSECDWVIEAVTEKLEIKKSIIKKISPYVRKDAVVSSNTSSLLIHKIAEDMPEEFRKRWLGTHFFNPVRHMKLLEVISTEEVSPEIVEAMDAFGEKTLGKRVVWAKDTPGFVANRLGNYITPLALRLKEKLDLVFEEIDAIAGTAIGRPSTGVFGLVDLAGLDIAIASVEGICAGLNDPQERAGFALPKLCYRMQEKGLIGNKAKQGFYKKSGKEKLVLDPDTLEYREMKPVKFASLDKANSEKTLSGKLEAFFEGDDKAAQFVWESISEFFLYSASKIPEISEDILNIDRGLCWGYNHDKGPFGIWDGLDLKKYIGRMEREGKSIPAWIKEMFAAGFDSFYRSENGVDYYYSIKDKSFKKIQQIPGSVLLKQMQDKIIMQNETGRLYDIGDNVLCLEMLGKAAITPELVNFINAAKKVLDENWTGMVICSEGRNFGTGLKPDLIAGYISSGDYAAVDDFVKKTQETFSSIKYSEKPVVFAIKGKVLDASLEMAMQGAGVQALAETYTGMCQIASGLTPCFGALREITVRTYKEIKGTTAFPVDVILNKFQNIINGTISGSAKDTKRQGYFAEPFRISVNEDLLLAQAKKLVLSLVEEGYHAPEKTELTAFGQTALGLLKASVMQMMEAKYASEHDMKIAWEIVDVLAGGKVIRDAAITEAYLGNLERAAFLRLCKEDKTKERIESILTTGKPLRN